MCRKSPWGSKVRGCQVIMSLASFLPDVFVLKSIWLGGEGPETNQPGGAKQDYWPEGRQRPGKLALYNGFKLSKGVTLERALTEFAHASFCMHSAFLINVLLFSLPSTSSPEFLLDKAGINEGLRPSQLVSVGQLLGLPVWELRPCLQPQLTSPYNQNQEKLFSENSKATRTAKNNSYN